MRKSHASPKILDKAFTKYWNLFVDEVSERDNFKKSHLTQLRVLCDLYVEYDKLIEIIDICGYSFDIPGGRNGDQIKVRPEVSQLNRCRAEIRAYSSMLGLLLTKDNSTGSEEVKEDW